MEKKSDPGAVPKDASNDGVEEKNKLTRLDGDKVKRNM